MSANSGCQLSCVVTGSLFSIHCFPGTGPGRNRMDSSERLARNASREPLSTDKRAKARSASIRPSSSDFKFPARSRTSNVAITVMLPFVELAGFHDEPHALQSCDVRQGIAIDRDEIRFKPRRDGADQLLQIQRLGAVRGQIDQRVHRLLAEPDALDGFSGIPSMRACVGVCAHHHLESGRPQGHLEHRPAESVRLFHRCKAFFGVVAQAEEPAFELEIVWEVEADVGIEPDAVLGENGECFLRREDAMFDCSAVRTRGSYHGFGALRVDHCPQTLRTSFAAGASSCSWERVGPPPSLMLAYAKILIRSAPSAFLRRTYSRSCCGVSRSSVIWSSEVRILGPGSTPRAIACRRGLSEGLPTLCTVVNPAINVTYAFSAP